jgi:ribosomal protein S18 acetylase RimI-like enzyme
MGENESRISNDNIPDGNIRKIDARSNGHKLTKEDIIKDVYETYATRKDIFPPGYYKYLKMNLGAIIDRGNYMYRNGVFIGWKVYQIDMKFTIISRTGYVKPTQIAVPAGSIMVDKVISKHEGKGYCRELFSEFLRSVRLSPDHPIMVYLKVATGNIRAIDFYRHFGFEPIGEIMMGNTPGYVMGLNTRLY